MEDIDCGALLTERDEKIASLNRTLVRKADALQHLTEELKKERGRAATFDRQLKVKQDEIDAKSTAREELARATDALEKERANVSALDQRLQESQAQIDAIRSEASTARDELVKERGHVSALGQQLNEKKIDIEVLRSEVLTSREELERGAVISTRRRDISVTLNRRLQEMQAENEELRNQASTAREELSRATDSFTKERDKNTSLEKRLHDKQVEIDDIRSQATTARGDLTKERERAAEMEQSLCEKDEEVAKLTQSTNDLSDKLSKEQERASELEQALRLQLSECSKYRQQAVEQQTTRASKEAEVASLENQLRAAQNELRLSSDLLGQANENIAKERENGAALVRSVSAKGEENLKLLAEVTKLTKTSNRLAEVSEQLKTEQANISTLDKRILEKQAEIDGLNREVSTLRNHLEQTSDDLWEERDYVEDLERRLHELEQATDSANIAPQSETQCRSSYSSPSSEEWDTKPAPPVQIISALRMSELFNCVVLLPKVFGLGFENARDKCASPQDMDFLRERWRNVEKELFKLEKSERHALLRKMLTRMYSVYSDEQGLVPCSYKCAHCGRCEPVPMNYVSHSIGCKYIPREEDVIIPIYYWDAWALTCELGDLLAKLRRTPSSCRRESELSFCVHYRSRQSFLASSRKRPSNEPALTPPIKTAKTVNE